MQRQASNVIHPQVTTALKLGTRQPRVYTHITASSDLSEYQRPTFGDSAVFKSTAGRANKIGIMQRIRRCFQNEPQMQQTQYKLKHKMDITDYCMYGQKYLIMIIVNYCKLYVKFEQVFQPGKSLL